MIAACVFLHWPPWSVDSARAQFPRWFWQLVLVPTGITMAISPLLRSVRAERRKSSADAETMALSLTPKTE